ncbi:YoaK family protein [Apilactobacillus apinorum]|uniref:YoaK family protein n=1 Tax=Apilactobacillus apinorum TaxID=1218495 RepID=A0ABP9ZJ82_9LACO|nr:YoaK family protein [Apilactobacillus apinorum]KOY68731.1 uncharacterized protein RZ74_05290 [Apilactobacillus apinorum]CAI2656445.1 PECL_778 Putative uncharacterized protein [Apilactobacillus apinorum]
MKPKDLFMHPFTAILLAIISGSIDAYSFVEHGGVFAGLQTGNTILLGISISHLDFAAIIKYLFSIFLFVLGVVLIKLIQRNLKDDWLRKTIIIEYEVAIILVTGLFVNELPDVLVVGLLSLVAAAQLQEFKLLKGNAFNPLMMTGNLGKIANNVYLTIVDGNEKAKSLLIDTIMIYVSFVLGAIFMGILTNIFHEYAVLFILVPLLMVLIFGYVFKNNEID